MKTEKLIIKDHVEQDHGESKHLKYFHFHSVEKAYPELIIINHLMNELIINWMVDFSSNEISK